MRLPPVIIQILDQDFPQTIQRAIGVYPHSPVEAPIYGNITTILPINHHKSP